MDMMALAGKRALVVLAAGAEEMEAVITADVLRRAGVAVTLAGLESEKPVECSRHVRIVPDKALEEAAQEGPYDVIVLPGGAGGAKRLAESEMVKRLLVEQEVKGRLIAAVCAAPSALAAHGIARGRTVTSHPAVRDALEADPAYSYSEARVCRDGTTITSRGPGTCFEFSLAIVAALCGDDKARDVAKPLMLP